ncbi:hypothetical protein RGQ29_032390 [Quercus rubra]|uniref:Uncharacterized protein n=1 Tax=Quercus rubra TaxID=3512 RepID=A0AAN7DWR9_QUERU|nr:hypothetical protein RGQ29_032390 [Quercus rubra]
MRTKSFCQGALLGSLVCFLLVVSCYAEQDQTTSGLGVPSHNEEFNTAADLDEGKFKKPIPFFKKPFPPKIPIFKKPIPHPIPVFKKPLPPPIPIVKKPLPPIPGFENQLFHQLQ